MTAREKPPTKIIRFAQELKRYPTAAEVKVARTLAENLRGTPYRYRTQCCFHAVDAGRWYIVDFYIRSLGLVIEVDGVYHWQEDTLRYDKARTSFLEKEYIWVVRVENEEVFSGGFSSKTRDILKEAEARRLKNSNRSFTKMYFVETNLPTSKDIEEATKKYLDSGKKITKGETTVAADMEAERIFREQCKDVLLMPHCVFVGLSHDIDRLYYSKKSGKMPYIDTTAEYLVPNQEWGIVGSSHQ